MKKKILATFWLPPEVVAATDDSFELIFPQEPVTGMTPFEETKKMLPEIDGVLILHELFSKEIIDLGGARLKSIGRLGVGCDGVDYNYAGSKGVAVINTPNTVTQPTAELTIAIMLDIARCITRTDKQLRRDKKCVWPHSYDGIASSLYGKTLGIIGFGRIGKAVSVKAHGLGMKIIYADVVAAPKEAEDAVGAKKVEMEALLREADVVTVHCPYIPENHHLINEKTLKLMKPGAYLVNASRGKMVDEAALVAALKNKTIKGAALDVFEFEPEINQELMDLDNVVMVPHIGTWSQDARVAMAREVLDGMCEYLKGGNPPNIFNRDTLKR